jgi:hypothetical protein
MLVIFVALGLASSKLATANIERKYVVQNNLITVFATVEFRNDGPSSVSTVSYCLTPRETKHVGLITASFHRRATHDFASSLPLKRDGSLVTVTLVQPLDMGKLVTLYFVYTLGSYFLFLKPTVGLNQRIGLFFNTTQYYRGPYPTEQSSLVVEGIQRASVIRHSDHPNVRWSQNDLEVSTSTTAIDHDFEVEFLTDKSLQSILRLDATTSVSHWGKSKQSIFYEVENSGPKFVGEFNRIDFSRSSPCHLQEVPLTPPRGAYGFWAHDEGGQLQRNIPTDGTNIIIPLRGPMMSSWRATFTTGWTINTDAFVSGHYVFQTDLIVPTFPAPIRTVTARFILPEGADIRKVEIPIAANVTRSIELANLDLRGRVVVTVETANLASTDRIPVIIDYQLGRGQNFLKIALLSLASCAIFLGIVGAHRIDLGITVPHEEKTD